MARSHRRITALAAALALALVPAVAAAASPPPTGPEFPPPGGVTVTSAGDNGRAGGATWTYTDLETARFESLWWSVWSGALPQLSMDGAADEPGETMTFSASASDLPGGVLVFAGSAELPGLGTYPTSVTITTTTADGDPLAMEAAGDAGLPDDIGGAAVVTGHYRANVLFRVAGQPAKDFFDAARTDPSQGGDLRTSIGGGFYYVPANVLPEASFTYSPESPRALQAVTFDSTSSDPDGAIAETAWDLDGDGAYDDATGETASRAFPEAGEYTVGVRVTDDRGGAATATQTVTVRTCEPGPVTQALRQVGAAVGAEGQVRQVNCDVVEPLGLGL